MTRNYRNPRGLPYSPPDADSYTYVDGRGFAPTPPVITERRLLQWCANGIGFSILFYIIFSFTLPGVVLGIFQIFNPYMHIYSDGTVLSPLIMEIVELISGNLSLLLPFLLLNPKYLSELKNMAKGRAVQIVAAGFFLAIPSGSFLFADRFIIRPSPVPRLYPLRARSLRPHRLLCMS